MGYRGVTSVLSMVYHDKRFGKCASWCDLNITFSENATKYNNGVMFGWLMQHCACGIFLLRGEIHEYSVQ